MIDKIGWRKIAAALIILAVGVIVTVLKGDVPSNLEHLLEIIFGVFVIGNGVEHVSAAVTARAQAQASDVWAQTEVAPPVDLTPVTAELAAIHEDNAKILQSLETTQQAVGVIFQLATGRQQQPKQP